MNIRQATINDSENFIKMLYQLDSETKYMMFEVGERKADISHIESMIGEDSSKLLTLVIDDNNAIGGFLSAERGSYNRIKHSAYIVIGILSEYRGKGLGTKLFEQLDLWAKFNNITRLELTVIEGNSAAIKLYEKMGFKKEGLKENSMIIDKKYVNEYYMAKILL